MSIRQRLGISYGETRRRHHAWELASEAAAEVERKYGKDSKQADRAWTVSDRARKEWRRVRGRG